MANFEQQKQNTPKPKSSTALFRRDPETGMLQMVKAKQETREALQHERRHHGVNSYRVSQYFEAAMSGVGAKQEFKADCKRCSDVQYLTIPVETPLGIYEYAVQCDCQYHKADGFGFGVLTNIKDLESICL